MTGFTDEDLDDFRKEVGNRFYVPLNYQMFGRIANMPMWERVLFVWKHKKQHGCDSEKEKDVLTEGNVLCVDCGEELIAEDDDVEEKRSLRCPECWDKNGKDVDLESSVLSKAEEHVKVRVTDVGGCDYIGCEKGSVTSADETRQKGMCAVTRKVESAVSRSAHRIPSSPSQEPKEETERREG